jgi:hypothetical protein
MMLGAFGPASHLLEDEHESVLKMRFELHILALCLSLLSVKAQNATVDKCPKTDHACTDVINSSLCLSQGAAANASASTMAACVQYDGGASNLPGAVKVSFSLDLY